jgi:sugar phosphate isomerase/epimerase
MRVGNRKRDTGNGGMDRRTFVATAGALIGSTTFPGSRFSFLGRRRKLERVGLQLYTVRGLMKQDFEGTLAKVAQIGYREVEFAGYFDHTPADVRAILDRHALASPGAHVSYESTATGWDQVLDAARVIGHRYIIVAWIPESERKDLDAWKRVAERFTKAGEACRRSGLQFAFHNHSYEFQPVAGRLPYDVLLEAADPQLVKMEMDLFWITNGNQDPLAYFRKYPGRFPLVHVKDMAPGADRKMVDVGKGKIDWKSLFAQSQLAGIEHYFVEHDEPPDPIASIQASYDYLARLEF